MLISGFVAPAHVDRTDFAPPRLLLLVPPDCGRCGVAPQRISLRIRSRKQSGYDTPELVPPVLRTFASFQRRQPIKLIPVPTLAPLGRS